MSYTVQNFKTKKAVKDALASGKEIRCYNPGLGPVLTNFTGSVSLEGPHYPQPHRWYAVGQLQDGILISIK